MPSVAIKVSYWRKLHDLNIQNEGVIHVISRCFNRYADAVYMTFCLKVIHVLEDTAVF